MPDRITEILADGTVYCFDLDVCNKAADEALEQLYNKEGVELEFDYTATVFSLFINCIHILSLSGWTTEDLINEVIEHSEDNTDIDE